MRVGYTETSLDQAYTPVIALHTYAVACDLATPAERTEVQQRVRAPARPGPSALVDRRNDQSALGLIALRLSDRCCRQLRDHGHWWIRQEYKYDYLGKVWEVFGANEGELKQFGRIGSPSTALKIPVGMVR